VDVNPPKVNPTHVLSPATRFSYFCGSPKPARRRNARGSSGEMTSSDLADWRVARRRTSERSGRAPERRHCELHPSDRSVSSSFRSLSCASLILRATAAPCFSPATCSASRRTSGRCHPEATSSARRRCREIQAASLRGRTCRLYLAHDGHDVGGEGVRGLPVFRAAFPVRSTNRPRVLRAAAVSALPGPAIAMGGSNFRPPDIANFHD
jgi:hypothetical protein